jgi:hypothetical protein
VIDPVEAGAWREAPQYELTEMEYVTASQDREFPWARHIAFRVVGDSMNNLKPIPLLPRARVVGLDCNDIDSKAVLRDDLVVVVEQTRDAWQTHEWTAKQLVVFPDRYEFHPRSTNDRHKPILVPAKVFHDPSEEEGRTVRVLALIKQIINDVTY